MSIDRGLVEQVVRGQHNLCLQFRPLSHWPFRGEPKLLVSWLAVYALVRCPIPLRGIEISIRTPGGSDGFAALFRLLDPA